MLSKSEYARFTAELIPILNDCYVPDPTEDGVREGQYYYTQGLSSPAKEYMYFYDKYKLAAHRAKLQSMCAAQVLPRQRRQTSGKSKAFAWF